MKQLSIKARKRLESVFKWSKLVAKFAALCTTVTGAVTALTSSSITTGFAMGAVGATSFAAAKNIPVDGYEKTRHIPPVRTEHNVTMAELAVQERKRQLLKRKEAAQAAMNMTFSRAGFQEKPGGSFVETPPPPAFYDAEKPAAFKAEKIAPPQKTFFARKEIIREEN